jgi:hypothetical protein
VDQALSIEAPGVLANDSHLNAGQPGIELTVQVVTEPTHGEVKLNPDGSFDYTPAPGFEGTDSFLYTASDGRLSAAGPRPVSIVVQAAP